MKIKMLNKMIPVTAFIALFALSGPAQAGDGYNDNPGGQEDKMMNNNVQMEGDIKTMGSSVQAPALELTADQAREIAREANMLGRPSLPAEYQGQIAPGYLFDNNSSIVREIVSEPLKSRLPHYAGYDWLIVGQDLVLVNNRNNAVTEVLYGVFE